MKYRTEIFEALDKKRKKKKKKKKKDSSSFNPSTANYSDPVTGGGETGEAGGGAGG